MEVSGTGLVERRRTYYIHITFVSLGWVDHLLRLRFAVSLFTTKYSTISTLSGQVVTRSRSTPGAAITSPPAQTTHDRYRFLAADFLVVCQQS